MTSAAASRSATSADLTRAGGRAIRIAAAHRSARRLGVQQAVVVARIVVPIEARIVALTAVARGAISIVRGGRLNSSRAKPAADSKRAAQIAAAFGAVRIGVREDGRAVAGRPAKIAARTAAKTAPRTVAQCMVRIGVRTGDRGVIRIAVRMGIWPADSAGRTGRARASRAAIALKVRLAARTTGQLVVRVADQPADWAGHRVRRGSGSAATSHSEPSRGSTLSVRGASRILRRGRRARQSSISRRKGHGRFGLRDPRAGSARIERVTPELDRLGLDKIEPVRSEPVRPGPDRAGLALEAAVNSGLGAVRNGRNRDHAAVAMAPVRIAGRRGAAASRVDLASGRTGVHRGRKAAEPFPEQGREEGRERSLRGVAGLAAEAAVRPAAVPTLAAADAEARDPGRARETDRAAGAGLVAAEREAAAMAALPGVPDKTWCALPGSGWGVHRADCSAIRGSRLTLVTLWVVCASLTA
jgi:hypothetical protein